MTEAPLSPRMELLLTAALHVVAEHGLRGLTHRAVDRAGGPPRGQLLGVPPHPQGAGARPHPVRREQPRRGRRASSPPT